MVRSILAAIAGYVVLVIALFILMTAAWVVVGADGAFQTGSYEVTGTWIAASIVLSVAAAVLAGFVCRAIGRTELSVNVLVGIVLVLGVVSAFYEIGMERMTTARPDDISMFEAMANGIQPVWLSWLNPILGAIGVLFGGKLKGEAETEPAE